jgi:hypothetical protein
VWKRLRNFFAENAPFSFLYQKNGPVAGFSGGVLVYGGCITPAFSVQYVPQSIVIHDPCFSPRTPTFSFCTKKMDAPREPLVLHSLSHSPPSARVGQRALRAAMTESDEPAETPQAEQCAVAGER